MKLINYIKENIRLLVIVSAVLFAMTVKNAVTEWSLERKFEKKIVVKSDSLRFERKRNHELFQLDSLNKSLVTQKELLIVQMTDSLRKSKLELIDLKRFKAQALKNGIVRDTVYIRKLFGRIKK